MGSLRNNACQDGVVLLLTVILFGVAFRFLIGLNDTLYDIFRPAILIMQAIPIITWLALVMFIWGIGWTGPVVVSILALIPQTEFFQLQSVFGQLIKD